MHPLEPLEGGLTHVEVRVLRELGAAAGGRDVFVWTGRELGDDELRSGAFKQEPRLQCDRSAIQGRQGSSTRCEYSSTEPAFSLDRAH